MMFSTRVNPEPRWWKVLLWECGPVLSGCVACLVVFFGVERRWIPDSVHELAWIILLVLTSLTVATGLFLPIVAGVHLVRKHERHRKQTRRLILLSIVAFLIDGAIGFVFLNIAGWIFLSSSD
jgi:hypothetical protein